LAEWVFLAAALVFLRLGSANWYDGDGLRYAPWNAGMHWFSGSGHALTPVWVRAWWAAVGWMVPDDFDARVKALQCFNHLCGALSAFLVVRIVRKSGGVMVSALAAGTLLLGMWCVAYHATHYSEPIVALTWTLLAWERLGGPGPPSSRNLALSAFAYAVAAASYQSFFFAAPALLLATGSVGTAVRWSAVAALSGFVLFTGAAIGTGARDVGDVMAYAAASMEMRGKGVVWGVMSPRRLLQAVLGASHMVLSLYSNYEWAGFSRSFGPLPAPDKAAMVAKIGAALAGYAWVAIRAWRLRREGIVLQAAVMFLPSALVAAYWDPYYLKMWLLPAGALAVLAGHLARTIPAGRALACVAGGVLATNALTGLRHDIDPRNAQVRTLEALEAAIGPKDMLIGDSWSLLTRFFAKYEARRTLYSTSTAGDDPGLARLKAAVAATRAAGGRVFIYGLLETSDRDWAESSNLIGGLSVEVRDEWRRHSRRVWEGVPRGLQCDLWELVGPWP
jgi:hypothetical protein